MIYYTSAGAYPETDLGGCGCGLGCEDKII